MNTFNAQMVNGEMAINFVGEIGSYWKEGEKSFNTNGMRLSEIDAKVNQIVATNKVIMETPLKNRCGIEPMFLTYLISSEKLANVIKLFIKEKTEVDVELAVGYDVNTFHALLIFNENWLIDLSQPVYDQIQAGLWEGFDVDDEEENMSGILSLIFGLEEDNYAETFNFTNENGVFDVEIKIPYKKAEQIASEPFISIYADGGIIQEPTRHASLEEAVESMNRWLFDTGFDYESDDARIYNADDEEVYSFSHEFYDKCRENDDIDEDAYVKLALMLWKGEINESDNLDDLLESLNE